MKNSRDTIGNRTRDFPGCSSVHQPTASPRAVPCPLYPRKIRAMPIEQKAEWIPGRVRAFGHVREFAVVIRDIILI